MAGDLPPENEWYPNECMFCTREAALACDDPECRSRRLGEVDTDMTADTDPAIADPSFDGAKQALRDLAAAATTLTVPDSPKMLRETFCVAQSAIGLTSDLRAAEHMARLQRLADECDRHRPVDQAGNHGELHTPTCGCEDK